MYNKANTFAIFKNINVPDSIWCGHYQDEGFHRFYLHSDKPGDFVRVIVTTDSGFANIEYLTCCDGEEDGYGCRVDASEAFSVINYIVKSAISRGFGDE